MARYIDAEKLKDFIDSQTDSIFNWDKTTEELYHDLCELVDDEPTADVQEVKHGKWVLTQEEHICGDFIPTLQCSECGNYEFYGKAIGTKFNYCPNCGARMEDKK